MTASVPKEIPEPEREIITYAHEKICIFSKMKEVRYSLFYLLPIFFPFWAGGWVIECEPVVCGLAERAGFQNGM